MGWGDRWRLSRQWAEGDGFGGPSHTLCGGQKGGQLPEPSQKD